MMHRVSFPIPRTWVDRWIENMCNSQKANKVTDVRRCIDAHFVASGVSPMWMTPQEAAALRMRMSEDYWHEIEWPDRSRD